MAKPLTDKQIDALNRRGIWLIDGLTEDTEGQRYSMAWSNHTGRWESSAAHIDMVLREVQSAKATGAKS